MFATGFPSPVQEGNNDVLKTVSDCGLFHLASEHDPSEQIAAHIDEWVCGLWIGNGHPLHLQRGAR